MLQTKKSAEEIVYSFCAFFMFKGGQHVDFNAMTCEKALPMDEAIQAMKEAYASLSNGTAVVPLRTRLPIPDSEALSLFMPAFVNSRMETH